MARWLIISLLLTIWQGEKIAHSEAKWRELLGRERYNVMRKKGTEAPFLGEYVFTDREGIYVCAACQLPLFDSKNKYLSGGGYPTFTQPIFPKNVYYKEDLSLAFKRYEVLCSKCDSHLGHIFNDRLDKDSPHLFRYCINSIAIIIKP